MIRFLKLMMHFNKQQEINEQITIILCSVYAVVGVSGIIWKIFNFFYSSARAFVSVMQNLTIYL